jgi:hypothetical protein
LPAVGLPTDSIGIAEGPWAGLPERIAAAFFAPGSCGDIGFSVIGDPAVVSTLWMVGDRRAVSHRNAPLR